ncbi:hypothetical protein ACLI4U_15165 [Natrialbaceae archaeon A-CW2]
MSTLMDDHDEMNDETPSDDSETVSEYKAQLELLTAENRRLRAEYARARTSAYRRTAAGMGAIGVVAVAGGLLFPGARDVLFILGAIGLFGGLLTYYLTPERFVAADVGERVYAAAAANQASITEHLGLRPEQYYVQIRDTVYVFVPLHADAEVPENAHGPFVLEEDQRGVLLETAGDRLFRAFEQTLSGSLASSPTPLAQQLCDGLVEQFELATRATPDVDGEDGRVTIAVTGSAFGAVDRFDHPIPSFLAAGLATGLERPVTLEVTPGDERADWLVTCRFESAG